MSREEALEVIEMELRMMITGDSQVMGKCHGKGDLILRNRVVRNILVECMEADWPDYETMIEETGFVSIRTGTHGDRGPYKDRKSSVDE